MAGGIHVDGLARSRDGESGLWGVESPGKLSFAFAMGPSQHCFRVAGVHDHVDWAQTRQDKSFVPVASDRNGVCVPSSRCVVVVCRLGSGACMGSSTKPPLGSPRGNDRCGSVCVRPGGLEHGARGRTGADVCSHAGCPQNVGRQLQFEISDELLRARSDLGLDCR